MPFIQYNFQLNKSFIGVCFIKNEYNNKICIDREIKICLWFNQKFQLAFWILQLQLHFHIDWPMILMNGMFYIIPTTLNWLPPRFYTILDLKLDSYSKQIEWMEQIGFNNLNSILSWSFW